MSTQTLKSASESRVRTDRALHLGAARIQGFFYDTCPSSSHELMNDEYGRPVNQNTLDMRSAECNPRAPHPQSASNHLQRENNERPYVQIAPSGLRGGADFMGLSRDRMPQDLYADGNRGNFVRHGSQGNHLPYPPAQQQAVVAERGQPSSKLPSHDATSSFYHRG